MVSPKEEATWLSGSPLIGVCQLASGGMGTVELALRQEGRFERLYALKRLHPSHRDDPQLRSMFLEEARLAGMIRHPNVVGVLDVGEDSKGPYLVMDYVDGVPLDKLIGALARQGELLPVQVCARIAAAAAEGLHAAHELVGLGGARVEVVHRDVSPQNILIGFDGSVRVADFGIAKALGGSAQTSAGILKGKIGYMAPEQLRFEEPDRRADLFALGVVLYEMLSGQRLFDAKDGGECARRILSEPPPDIGLERDDVPPSLVALSFELLAKERSLRPKSAKDVARQLDAIVAELSLLEGPIDLDTFVAEALHDEREDRRRRIDDALSGAKTSPAPAEALSLSLLQTQPRVRRSRRALWLAPLALALVLVSTYAVVRSLDRAEPPARAVAARLAQAPEPAAPAVEPTPPVEPSAAPSQEPAPEPASSHRRARAPRRSEVEPVVPASQPARSRVPTWGWPGGAAPP